MPVKLVKVLFSLVAFISIGFIFVSQNNAADRYEKARQELIREIEEDVRRTSLYIGKKDLNQKVMDAMAVVERHEFVPPNAKNSAYENRPLAIGHGQTISQPYIVALMTDLLAVDQHSKVLEIGTGSGYQAAVLGELASTVFSIEIIEPLGLLAKKRLHGLGYENVTVKIADGYYGWPEQGPFDAIIVTAAAGHVPPPLIKQLKPGGKMVIPVGSHFMTQQLVVIDKDKKGEIKTRQILPVRFVPLTGGH